MATESSQASQQPESPWEMALNKLREWDPAWAERAVNITTNPWTDGCLPTKFIELVRVQVLVNEQIAEARTKPNLSVIQCWAVLGHEFDLLLCRVLHRRVIRSRPEIFLR